MRFVAITYRKGATLEVTFGGNHAQRPQESIDVDEFIGIKSHRAKGKRITNYDVASLRFIEPEVPEEEDYIGDADEDMIDNVGVGLEDGAEESIDMNDIVGEEIKADPTVDYTARSEGDDAGFSASQLDLFS